MKMLDLRRDGNRYYFRLDQGEDFWEAVRLLKATFKPAERQYHPDTKEWSVPATPTSEARLSTIFHNAQASFVYLKAQLALF